MADKSGGHGRGTMQIINSELSRARRRFAATAALIVIAGASSLAAAEEYRWGGRIEPPARVTSAPARPMPAQVHASAEPTSTAVRPILRESDIAGLRSALQLTPEQMPHWTPVAAALSSLARSQSRSDAGYIQRFRDKASALADTAAQLRRLRDTAMPLIISLNDSQKRAAMAYARRMGYGPLVAMF